MTIIISSCDSYQDCFYPFFSLFQKFIDDIDDHKIYLVTDNFNYKGHSFVETITSSKNGEPIPWANRMANALDVIEEDIFLLLMDDYFLYSTLNAPIIKSLKKIIESNNNVGAIRLNSNNKNNNGVKEFKILNKVNKFSKYRINLQPTLWDKTYFKSILILGESPWQFELLGSIRSNFMKKKIFQISNHWIIENGLIYNTTRTGGIVKGKWLKSEYNRIENLLEIKIKSSRDFHNSISQPNKFIRKLILFKKVFFDLKVIAKNIIYFLKNIF